MRACCFSVFGESVLLTRRIVSKRVNIVAESTCRYRSHVAQFERAVDDDARVRQVSFRLSDKKYG